MLYLIQLEWKKLRVYRPFRVISLLYLIMLPVAYMGAYYFFNYVLEQSNEVDEIATGFVSSLTSFPKVWRPLAFASSWFTFFFMGFLGTNLITMEYSNRTLRQTIINGISRKQFFLGKLYTMLVISLLATLVYALISLIVGFIYTDYIFVSKVFENIIAVPMFFLQCFAYMCVAMLFGLLIKRSGIAIMLFFIYAAMESIGRLMYMGIYRPQENYINFLPMNVFGDLAPLPFPKEWMSDMNENNFSYLLDQNSAILFGILYLGIIISFSYWIFKRRDL